MRLLKLLSSFLVSFVFGAQLANDVFHGLARACFILLHLCLNRTNLLLQRCWRALSLDTCTIVRGHLCPRPDKLIQRGKFPLRLADERFLSVELSRPVFLRLL